MAGINNPTDNVTIFGGDNSAKAVTSTTVGAKELLDVNASSDPTQYSPEFDYDITGDVVTSAADATLFTFSGAGVIDMIAVSSAVSSSWSIIVDIDGVEKFRISMTDLGSTLGLTGSAQDLIFAATANKQFRWLPKGAAGFTTSFSVKARATGADVTLYHLVNYRELVT